MLIPASVTAYVHDLGIRRAVRELLAEGTDAVLPGLTWDELPRLYRAQLAAVQVQADWGCFAIDLWDAVWGGLLEGWTPLSPDEQIAKGGAAHPTLGSLTDTSDGSLWFGRLFEGPYHTFYASLAAVPSKGLSLFVACEGVEASVDFAGIGAVADDDGNWTSNLALRLDGPELDAAPLRALAEAVMTVADEATTTRRRTRR